MPSLQTLTILSTTCIVGSGIFLIAGWFAIKRKAIPRHRTFMTSAASLAALFLVAYVTRWSLYGSQPFAGTGGWRVFYLSTLVPHILLALAIVPMIVRLLYLALKKKDFAAHRRLGRVTFPIWLFVSASGWVIYTLLYVLEF